MSERGFVVAESWLRKIEDAASTSPESGGRRGSGSALFYDIRPARLQSAWTQNAAGLWTATARFIVNDAVDDSFTFPVCAPTATGSPGGTAESTRFFVVWRGRWELLSSASGGGSGSGSGSGHTYRLDTTSQNVLILPSDTLDVVTGLAVVGNSLTYTTTNIRIVSSNSMTSVLKTAQLVQTN